MRQYIETAWQTLVPRWSNKFRAYLHQLYGLGHITEAEQNAWGRRLAALEAQLARARAEGTPVLGSPLLRPSSESEASSQPAPERALTSPEEVDAFLRAHPPATPTPAPAPKRLHWTERAGVAVAQSIPAPVVRGGMEALRIAGVPGLFAQGVLTEGAKTLVTGKPGPSLGEVWRQAVSGERPGWTADLFKAVTDWEAKNFDPAHPVASHLKNMAAEMGALGLGLTAEALADPLTWVFAGFSGARVGGRQMGSIITPRAAQAEVARAARTVLEPAVGAEVSQKVGQRVLDWIGRRGVAWTHVGEARPSATLEVYTVVRDYLRRAGAANPEELAGTLTKQMVVQLAPQPRFWQRGFLRAAEEPILHPQIIAEAPTVRPPPAEAPPVSRPSPRRVPGMEQVVAEAYSKAGLPVDPVALREAVAAAPEARLGGGVKRLLSDYVASLLPPEWQDALVQSLHRPRAIEDYLLASARRLSQQIRNPTAAAKLQAFRTHALRASLPERRLARALAASGELPEEAAEAPIRYVRSLSEVPPGAKELLSDLEAVREYAQDPTRTPVPAALREPERLARLERFRTTRIRYDTPMLAAPPEDRLAAALSELGQVPEGEEPVGFVRRTMMKGDQVDWSRVPRPARRLLREAELLNNFFQVQRWPVPPAELVARLRAAGDTIPHDFGLILHGYLPQFAPRGPGAVAVGGAEATAGRFALSAEAENIWTRMVQAAREGRPADIVLNGNALADLYVRDYARLYKRAMLYETLLGREGAEPGLAKLVRVNSPEMRRLVDQGWQVMTEADGRTPLPGMIQGDRMYLVPREFARQYLLRSAMPTEVMRVHPLLTLLAKGRSWFVTTALMRLPFLKLQYPEQLTNIALGLGPEGLARDLGRTLAWTAEKVLGRPVPVEQVPTWMRAARIGAAMGLESVMDAFTIAPPHTVADLAERWGATLAERVVRKLLPEADEALVRSLAEEAWSVRGTGSIGQIRAIEEEMTIPALRNALAEVGANIEDLRKWANASWGAVEDLARLAFYIRLRLDGYPPSAARRLTFEGFVPYIREMYPPYFAMASNYGLWFMRYTYGRTRQLLTKSLLRPVYPYVFAQSYRRQDEARAAPYEKAAGQYLIVARAAKEKGRFNLEWHPVPSEAVPVAFHPTEEQAPLLGEGQTRIFFQRMRLTWEETPGEALRFLMNPLQGVRRYADPYLKALAEAQESGKPPAERLVEVGRTFPGAGYLLGERPVETPWLRYAAKVERQNLDRLRRGEPPLELKPRPQSDVDLETQLKEAQARSLLANYKWVDLDVMDLTRSELEEMLRLGRRNDQRYGRSRDNWLWPEEIIEAAIAAKREGRPLPPFGTGPYSETERAMTARRR